MRTFPQWATPERRGYLAMRKVVSHRRLERWGLDLLTGELFDEVYELAQKRLVETWKELDRDERAFRLEAEKHSLHPREHIRQGGFDSIMREIFLDSQPSYYPEAVGVDALRFQPVAKVRVASSPVRLWVDVPAPVPELPPAPEGVWSKHALRKWRRYGAGPIARAISQAVDDYQNSPS